MQDIIKQIRQYMQLSQTEMAKKLNVGFATLNRWENGHAQPARLAQEKLLELCEDYSVPVYEMIIGKIKMITAQGNPPFEIGAFAHVASNPILVFSIEFAAIIQMFP